MCEGRQFREGGVVVARLWGAGGCLRAWGTRVLIASESGPLATVLASAPDAATAQRRRSAEAPGRAATGEGGLYLTQPRLAYSTRVLAGVTPETAA